MQTIADSQGQLLSRLNLTPKKWNFDRLTSGLARVCPQRSLCNDETFCPAVDETESPNRPDPQIQWSKPRPFLAKWHRKIARKISEHSVFVLSGENGHSHVRVETKIWKNLEESGRIWKREAAVSLPILAEGLNFKTSSPNLRTYSSTSADLAPLFASSQVV